MAKGAIGFMMMRYVLAIVYSLPTILVTVGIFFVLLGLTVSCLFIFKPLYVIGFERHGVSEATGITSYGLEQVADNFVNYFRSDDEYIAVVVDVYGVERSILSHKETVHMRDVKQLVNGFRNVGFAAMIMMVAYVISLVIKMRSQAIPILTRRLRKSSLAIIITALIFGLLVAVAFPFLFTLFHLISFSNDYWLLDPRQDYLVMLFTPNFFLEATGLLVTLILLECVVIISSTYLVRSKNQ